MRLVRGQNGSCVPTGSLVSVTARILCADVPLEEIPLSKLRTGWRPVVIGGVLGMLLGFAGGAGAGLLATTPVAAGASAPSDTPSASQTPTLTPTQTPTPTQIPVSKKAAASSGATKPSVSYLFGPARPSPTCGRPGARVVRFRVLVEQGLPTTPSQFVAELRKVLCDERSWIGSGKVQFRYDPNGPLLIGLRTADSTEDRCMALIHLSVNHYYSCATRSEVVLNSDRWFHGSDFWPGPVPAYRQMLVNHEVGHALGQHHRSCPKDGNPAPVMMQQSKGMTTGSNTCKPNPWPLAYEKRSLSS
jgi:uncharacterized protein DUF3152